MNKKLLTPIAVIVGMTAVSIGSSFALFTSKSESDILINAGTVKVSATIGNLKTYSGEWNSSTETYDILERTGDKQGTFINGGRASISGSILNLDRFCPLDKVTFDINVKNDSDISIKYRTVTKCVDGPVLYSVLDKTATTKIGETQSVEVLDSYESYSHWTPLEPGVDGATVSFVIEFKDHEDIDNYYQNLSTQIQFAVEAIQGNAHTVDTTNKHAYDKVSANVSKDVDTTIDESGTEVVDDTYIQNSDASATVIVPSQAKTEDTSTPLDVNSKLKLTVEAKEEQESPFVIKETDVVAPYEIDVTKITQVGTEVVSEKLVGDANNLFEVSLFVGEELSDVRVYHRSAQLTKVNDLISPRVDQTFFYNEITGDVIIWTSSFSEYTVVYDNIPFIEADLIAQGYVSRIGTTGYKTLAEAFNEQKDGETVVLMKDVSGQEVTWQKLTKGDYSFDLEGHDMIGKEVTFARPTLQVIMAEDSNVRIFDSKDDSSVIRGYCTSYPICDKSGNHIRSVVYFHGFPNYTTNFNVVIENITIQAEENMSAITNNLASSKQSLEIKSGVIDGDIVLDLSSGGDVEIKVHNAVEILGKVNFIADSPSHRVDSTLNADGSTTYKTVVDYSNCDFLLTNRRSTSSPEINTWASSDLPTSCSFNTGSSATQYHNLTTCRDIKVNNSFSITINTSYISYLTLDLNGKTIQDTNYPYFKSNNASDTITICDNAGNGVFNTGINSYMGLNVNKVTLIIESGSIILSKFALTNNGSVVIKGGSFTIPTTYVETLKGFVSAGSTVIINGSSFTK